MKFGSVCSGIEAASVAWKPLGWEPEWFAEIEPFPSAVLKHHYPQVPNLGDMTALPERILSGEIEAPEVFCGGTPCQAFSVAGNRESLADARGNLTLTFCEIANAIDTIRAQRGMQPCIIFWENVPGVLNTKDNAFGCFLGALAGEDCALEPPGGRWTDAGCVLGPERAIAWRTLDAQFFGLAQRRRRVFVVASARAGFDPAAVLFEFHGVRRDSAPSREPGEVAPTIPARSTGGGGLGTDFDCDGGVITMAHGQGGAEIGFDRGPTLTCNHEAPIAAYGIRTANTSSNGWGIQEEATHTLDQAMGIAVAHSLRGEGFDAGEDGTGRGTPRVPVAYATKLHNTASNQAGKVYEDYATSLDANSPPPAVFQPTPFDTTQVTSVANRSNPKPGDPCHPLAAGAHAPAIAFPANLSGTQHASTENLSPSLGAKNPTAVAESLYNKGFNHESTYASTQETNAGKILRTLREAIGEEAFAKWGLGILGSLQSPEILRQALHGLSIRPAAFSRSWVVHCSLSRQEDGSGWLLQSLRETGCEGCPPQGWEPPEQLAGELRAYLSELSQPGAQASRFMRDLWWASQGAGLLREALSAVQEMGRPTYDKSKPAHGGMQVRRLTVEECEFLQGFPRGHTLIPWRKKPASECPDGPRYKALGNSWAVPVVAWIGRRIAAEVAP